MCGWGNESWGWVASRSKDRFATESVCLCLVIRATQLGMWVTVVPIALTSWLVLKASWLACLGGRQLHSWCRGAGSKQHLALAFLASHPPWLFSPAPPSLQEEFLLPDYMEHQHDITTDMRAILVDWMVEVQVGSCRAKGASGEKRIDLGQGRASVRAERGVRRTDSWF